MSEQRTRHPLEPAEGNMEDIQASGAERAGSEKIEDFKFWVLSMSHLYIEKDNITKKEQSLNTDELTVFKIQKREIPKASPE